MGITSYIGNRKDAISKATRNFESTKVKEVVLDHSVRGNQVWVLTEITNKETGKVSHNFSVHLIKVHGNEVSIKVISVTSHPYHYNCPMRLVNKFEKTATFQDMKIEDDYYLSWKAEFLKTNYKGKSHPSSVFVMPS